MKSKFRFLYPNNLKNWEFDKEAPQIFCPGRAAVFIDLGSETQGRKFEAKPTRSKTSSSSCLGIIPLLFFIAAGVQAEEAHAEMDRMNFYAKMFGGANFLQNTTIAGNNTSYQTGYIVSGSLGYCCRPYILRLEVEYAFRRNAISHIHFVTQGSSHHGHFQTSSYMANLLWDLPLCYWGVTFWNIQPFIGAGIGYDFQQMHASNSRVHFRQTWKKFSWQAMAGFAYPIFRNTEVTLEYQFHQGGGHFYNHAVAVGLVYKFGFIR